MHDGEWQTVRSYRERLRELGMAKARERADIAWTTKVKVRSLRILVALIMLGAGVFGGVLTSFLIAPKFYWRKTSIPAKLESPACASGPQPTTTAPLIGLQAQAYNFIGERLSEEMKALSSHDMIKIRFHPDDVVVLFSGRMAHRAPVALLRSFSLAILWPSVIDVQLSVPDACMQQLISGYHREIAAYLVQESHRDISRGQFRMADASGTVSQHKCVRISSMSDPPSSIGGWSANATQTELARLAQSGSPWGMDAAAIICTTVEGEPDATDTSMLVFLIVNGIIALGLVLFLFMTLRYPLLSWLHKYANRVAPEYSFNMHPLGRSAAKQQLTGDAKTATGSPANANADADDEDAETESLFRLNEKLDGCFFDEFTYLQARASFGAHTARSRLTQAAAPPVSTRPRTLPGMRTRGILQVLDFLVPGSNPTACDRSLRFALLSSILHGLLGWAPLPLLYIGFYYVGCTSGLEAFPSEGQTSRCGLRRQNALQSAPLVLGALLIVMMVLHFLHCVVYYLNLPLRCRRPFRRLDYVAYAGGLGLCGLYLITVMMWIALSALLVPREAIKVLLLLASVAIYVIVIVIGLLKVVEASYDSRGRLKSELVELGGIPETRVVRIASSGLAFILLVVAWLLYGYLEVRRGLRGHRRHGESAAMRAADGQRLNPRRSPVCTALVTHASHQPRPCRHPSRIIGPIHADSWCVAASISLRGSWTLEATSGSSLSPSSPSSSPSSMGSSPSIKSRWQAPRPPTPTLAPSLHPPSTPPHPQAHPSRCIRACNLCCIARLLTHSRAQPALQGGIKKDFFAKVVGGLKKEAESSGPASSAASSDDVRQAV